jgi:PhoH-like ATPase
MAGESDGKESVGKKTYVLDTNVLIHNPEAIFSFGTSNVVIPLIVIQELDKLKTSIGETGYSARQTLRLVDSLRNHGGKITQGVPLREGGFLFVCNKPKQMLFDEWTPDHEIISTAGELISNNGFGQVVLVSKDTAVRIQADAKEISCEDYKKDKSSIFKNYGRVVLDDYTNGIKSVRYQLRGDELFRWNAIDSLKKIERERSVMGITPRNVNQECALDALRSPEIPVVALTGTAGAGKTLLALAVAVYQTTKSDKLYNQVLVARPTIPMGGMNKDIGYLPGDIKEKLAPWMQPIIDNLEVVIQEQEKNYGYQYLLDTDIIHIESLAHIRGRSLPKRYFIIDEAQNLTPKEIKAIVSRCGEGTKVVLTGDLDQIDTPYLDAESNGLAYLIGKYIKEQEDFCYIHLPESVRSSVAETAARLL